MATIKTETINEILNNALNGCRFFEESDSIYIESDLGNEILFTCEICYEHITSETDADRFNPAEASTVSFSAWINDEDPDLFGVIDEDGKQLLTDKQLEEIKETVSSFNYSL